jgi:hypothetical protein
MTGAPNVRYRNGHRRRQLRARLLRTTTVCEVCGHELDESLPAGHPMAAEVDERIPIAFGGDPLDPANVRLVHAQCNRAEWQQWRVQQTAPVTFVTSSRW